MKFHNQSLLCSIASSMKYQKQFYSPPPTRKEKILLCINKARIVKRAKVIEKSHFVSSFESRRASLCLQTLCEQHFYCQIIAPRHFTLVQRFSLLFVSFTVNYNKASLSHKIHPFSDSIGARLKIIRKCHNIFIRGT